MMNYKMQAAKEAVSYISPNQVIGLGAGATIAHLATELAGDDRFKETISFLSSSNDTKDLLESLSLRLIDSGLFSQLDIYFDGCDQVDEKLNAFKSGAGIHTDEKALAVRAKQFILLGDAEKYQPRLNNKFPFTVEILPSSFAFIEKAFQDAFEVNEISVRKGADNKNLINSRGSNIIDVRFKKLPDLSKLNQTKMWAGILDHSLFYQMATTAIICGPNGSSHLKCKR